MIRKENYKLNIHDDPNDPNDIIELEFFDLTSRIDEIAANNLLLGNLNPIEQVSFDELMAKNVLLNTGRTIQYNAVTAVTNSVDLTGITGVNANGNSINIPALTNANNGNSINIISVSIGGVEATNFTRTTDGITADQNWVSFTFNPASSGLATGDHDIVVTYNPVNNPRVFTLVDGYTQP